MSTVTKEFIVPLVEVGEIVWWYPGGDENQNPAPAVVTQINHRSLNLSVIAPNMMGIRVEDGVRHCDDGSTRPQELIDNGGWTLSAQREIADELRERIAKLEVLLGAKVPAK